MFTTLQFQGQCALENQMHLLIRFINTCFMECYHCLNISWLFLSYDGDIDIDADIKARISAGVKEVQVGPHAFSVNIFWEWFHFGIRILWWCFSLWEQIPVYTFSTSLFSSVLQLVIWERDTYRVWLNYIMSKIGIWNLVIKDIVVKDILSNTFWNVKTLIHFISSIFAVHQWQQRKMWRF